MKKIIIFLVGILSLSLVSCADFLTENNKSNTTAADYYSTDAGYESLVNACYSNLRTIFGGNCEIFEAGTDLFQIGKSNLSSTNNGLGNYKNLTAADGVVLSFYTNLYSAIKRCNDAIYYNTGHSATRLAEVRFLRAFYYFQLVQQFGGVALVTDYLNKPITDYPRNTTKEVYSFIISEMEAALTNLSAAGSTPDGRVNKRVANHYLALAYLTRGWDSTAGGTSDDFTKAISYATTAINNQGLTLAYEGTVSSQGVFWPGNEKNAEVIFSVQYSSASLASTTSGNAQSNYFGAYLGGSDASVLDGCPSINTSLQPTARLYMLLSADPTDTRFADTFMQTVYGKTATQCSFYSFFKASPQTKNVTHYYPKPGATTTDVAAWVALDPTNRSSTIVHYPGANAISWPSVLDYGYPCIKKFTDPSAAFGQNTSTRDLFLARLAETYLIRAEAEIKLDGEGTSTRAMNDINVVRNRAKATPITVSEATISYLLDERARELAGEYHRWNDLKRTGTLTTLAPLNPDVSSAVNMTGNDGSYKILRPIPQSAIALNGTSITQNPGY
ncbi:MAG: RagB/SusD family protein [Bacteroidetes bacterium]|nr:RagB/SusD family protein [Bacteroidota bacterium]